MFASGALRRAVPLVALLSSLTFAATASAEALRPAPPASFVDSVGVNIHPIFLDTANKDRDRVVGALTGLGVRHVRASPPRRRGPPRGRAAPASPAAAGCS